MGDLSPHLSTSIPHVATVLPFLHQQYCVFNCYSRPACTWLGFVSTERQGHYTLQLTQLLVGIFETMNVIQIKQAKALSNSSRLGFMVAAVNIYSGELCFKISSVRALCKASFFVYAIFSLFVVFLFCKLLSISVISSTAQLLQIISYIAYLLLKIRVAYKIDITI